MLNATCLHHLRWRKKKVDGFIIPAHYFENYHPSIAVPQPVAQALQASAKPVVAEDEPASEQHNNVILPVKPLPAHNLEAEKPEVIKPPKPEPTDDGSPRVSALSLSSIAKKRQLQENQKNIQRHAEELPRQSFSETDMKLLWNKFAQRLSDGGKKIMATYMQINDPVLDNDGVTIRLELPNEGSKAQFDNEKLELVGYLRGKLHNHDITVQTHVNEEVSSRHAFTPEEKFEKLKALNPAMETLRKLFDLDV